MTQEDKELLLKDLCTRLPYGTKLNIKGQDGPTLYNFDEDLYTIWIEGRFSINDRGEGDEDGICEIKPYLRPMSSMTEEEINEYENFIINEKDDQLRFCNELVFYNSHHLDYHGLIEKGLALEALENMYN